LETRELFLCRFAKFISANKA